MKIHSSQFKVISSSFHLAKFSWLKRPTLRRNVSEYTTVGLRNWQDQDKQEWGQGLSEGSWGSRTQASIKPKGMARPMEILAAVNGGSSDRPLSTGSRILFLCYLAYKGRFQVILSFKGLLMLSQFHSEIWLLSSTSWWAERSFMDHNILSWVALFGRIMAPQWSRVLIPGTCKCYLICKKGFFAVVIKWKILRWGDDPGLSGLQMSW